MSVYQDIQWLERLGPGAFGQGRAPEPGSEAAEREKRALEAWKRQLEQRVKAIEARLQIIEARGGDG